MKLAEQVLDTTNIEEVKSGRVKGFQTAITDAINSLKELSKLVKLDPDDERNWRNVIEDIDLAIADYKGRLENK